MNNSNNHARKVGIQSSGFPAQPNNRNQSTKLNSNGTVKPLSTPPFPPLKNANQSKCSCEKCRANHILATCLDYQKCIPSQQLDIVNKSNLCSNSFCNKQRKQNCPSTKRCHTCSGYHHTTLPGPGKIIRRSPAAFATSNSTCAIATIHEIQPVKQQSEPGNNSNASVLSKSQKIRYGQSFAKKIRVKFSALI